MSHEVGKWRKAGRFRVVLQKCTDPPQESIGAGRELQGLVRALDAGEHDTVDPIAHLSCRRQCKMGAVTDAPEVKFGCADLLDRKSVGEVKMVPVSVVLGGCLIN